MSDDCPVCDDPLDMEGPVWFMPGPPLVVVCSEGCGRAWQADVDSNLGK